MRVVNVICLVGLILLTATCGNVGKNVVLRGDNGHNSLISFEKKAPTCPNGGITAMSGLDLNYNGILDPSEITDAAPVCNGVDGNDGLNGHSALATIVDREHGGAAACAEDGVTLLVGVDLNDDTVLSPNEVAQAKDICNGANAASYAFTPVQLINPCGDAAGIYDEVFVKLANGVLLASFSDKVNGENTRFVILGTGTYETTDGDRCVFSVDASGNIFNEHH